MDEVVFVHFFDDVPLMVTVDAVGGVVFWSLRPLPSFDRFFKASVLERKRKSSKQGLVNEAPPVVSCATLCDADVLPNALCIGTDGGDVCRWDLGQVVQYAGKRAASADPGRRAPVSKGVQVV